MKTPIPIPPIIKINGMQSVIICPIYPIISETPDVGRLNNGSTFLIYIDRCFSQRAAAFIITQAAAQRLGLYVLS